jgi:ACS family glucarate transporter-like MFS transporter
MFSGRHRYLILLLVTLGLGLSVVDRAAVAIAGPLLVRDLGIGAVELGWLFSAFSWSYVAAQLPSGWIVDRLGARRTVGTALVLWAAGSVVMGASAALAHAFVVMVVLRVAMGHIHAPIGPAGGLSIAAWFPSTERGVAGSLFASSSYLALALFTPLLGWVAHSFGWPAMFFVLSAMVCLLAAAWWLRYDMPARHGQVTRAELEHIAAGGAVIDLGTQPRGSSAVPWADLRRMLGSRMVVGIMVSQYGISAITWFFVSWFPVYLVQERGMTLAEAGAVAALPGLAGFAGGLLTGLLSDRLLRRSGSLSVARTLPILIGTSVMAVSLAACTFAASNALVVVLLSLALFGKGFATLGWTVLADVFPARTIGFAGAALNMMSNGSGIVTSVAIGYLVSATGSFDAALWLMSAHAALAFASFSLVVRKVEPMRLEAVSSVVDAA